MLLTLTRGHRAAPLLVLGAILCIPNATRAQQPDASNCGNGSGPGQMLTLSWAEVPTEESLSVLPDGQLHLLEINRSAQSVRVEVQVIADAGTSERISLALPAVSLAAGARRAVPIQLDALGLSLNDMRFSGSLVAIARVMPLPVGVRHSDVPAKAQSDAALATSIDASPRSTSGMRGPNRRRVSSVDPKAVGTSNGDNRINDEDVFAPEVYFHRPAAGGTVLAYGGAVLRGRFRAGDLTGRIGVPIEGVALQRIVGGGAGIRRVGRTGEQRIASLEDGAEEPPTRARTAASASPAATARDRITSGGRRICIKWEIGLTDKGKLVKTGSGAWIREDYWSGGSGEPSGDIANPGPASPNLVVTARGVHVTLVEGAWSQAFDADPATGCFTFFKDDAGSMSMYVWAYATDKDGNVVQAVQPFGVFELPFVFAEVITPPPAGQQRTYQVGDFTPRATMAAIGAFASYRAHYGLSGKDLRIREDSTCPAPGGNNSSAHFDPNPAYADGIARIRIHTGQGTCVGDDCNCSGDDCNCDPGDHRRRKFLVTHEMGHAWMLLAAGVNQFEPHVVTGLVDAAESVCGTGSGYSIDSLEWNSLGAREGMGHFYGTEVFNDHSSGTAVFTWFGVPFDVEFNDPPEQGGRLFNVCSTPHRCGKATILDWLRMFWDWHTPFEAGQKPSIATMRSVYATTVTDDGLTMDNYFLKFRETVQNIIANQSFRDDWDAVAAWNGTDTNPNGMLTGPSCDTYGYPACACWSDRSEPLPDECLGTPGCPCADVQPLFNLGPEHLDEEGFFPDGIGSYLLNGPNGPGQQCFDASIGLPERGAVCGSVEYQAIAFPICNRCGLDTSFGCPCDLDSDCALNEPDLVCWASSDQGWAGNQSGLCLPGAETEAGRDHLTELPWFCLDNCGAKGNNYRCVYDQLQDHFPGIFLAHAQCLDVTCSAPVGFCESLPEAAFCQVDAMCPGNDENDWLDCCVGECVSKEDCTALGYPDFCECDFLPIGTSYGHCVPPECAAPAFFNGNQSYCHMFW